MSWMFWLTVFKCDKIPTRHLSHAGIVLGRQNEKVLWKEKGMEREMKFFRQGGEVVFHIIFSMWLSSSSFFFSLQDGKM